MLDSYELNSSVDGSGSRSHESLVDVDCEIPTSQPINIFDSRMVKTKQTLIKGQTSTKIRTLVNNLGREYQRHFLIKENRPVKLQVIWQLIMKMKISLLQSPRMKVPCKMQTSSRLCGLVNAEGPLVEKLEFTSMLLERDVISLE